MNVQWTNTAIEHLLAIYEYIASDSPMYADRIIDRLTRRSEQIEAFPRAGRCVPEYDREDTRSNRGVVPNYLRIKEEQIDVLAVFHSRQQLPPEL